MPPRYSYWTIIAGGLPTAFRALEREELMPTFTRLREKHPDAEMKWFARGKLWESPEAVRADTEKRRAAPAGTSDRSRHRDRPGGPPRDREWRPGGEHKDPRQKFKDAKTAKNVAHRRQKFARKHGDEGFDRPLPPPAAPKPEWNKAREGGPAPPKRAWDKPREGADRDRPPRRDDFRARDDRGGRPAPPKRDWNAPREGGPPYDRDRKGPPPRPEWRGKPGGAWAPKREWTKPRDGAANRTAPARQSESGPRPAAAGPPRRTERGTNRAKARIGTARHAATTSVDATTVAEGPPRRLARRSESGINRAKARRRTIA